MKKRLALSFTFFLMFFAFVAWLSGYNFDTRNIDVAFVFLLSMLGSVLGTLLVEGIVAELS